MDGSRLKDLRKKMHMTQQELANYLGLSPKMISFYELGQRNPPDNILVKLSQKFGVSTDYLLGSDKTIYIEDRLQGAASSVTPSFSRGHRQLLDISDLPPDKQDFARQFIDTLKAQAHYEKEA